MALAYSFSFIFIPLGDPKVFSFVFERLLLQTVTFCLVGFTF